jgi:chorismate mutase/prephenate dehydratase
LARALDLLGRAGVNLTSIVSRPAPQRPWEYRFFLDIEGDAGAPPASAAIAALGSNGAHVRVLGVYDSSGASE